MIRIMCHYVQKVKTVGIKRFVYGVWYRFKKLKFQQRARAGKLLPFFFKRHSKSLPFLATEKMRQKDLILKANQFADRQFNFLGSSKKQYPKIPWYEDIRLQQKEHVQDISFDKNTFYGDLSFAKKRDGLQKDIKLPWELARFQYAPLLAVAYRYTGNKKYLIALQLYLYSFLDSAHYLHGIHWLNPMEVGLRVTSWVQAISFLKKEEMPKYFFNKMQHSLSEHKQYLESNWEWYDGRTNNHFLSNIIGHLYACWFFDDAKGFRNSFKKLKQEFEWQILPDGSSYEGSTSYHQFVTDLFLHGFALAKTVGTEISPEIMNILKKVIAFGDATEQLSIGDEDGGVVCYSALNCRDQLKEYLGLSSFSQEKSFIHFTEFGLSILKEDEWDVSLRHHCYALRQPSAHFHEDAGSITMRYKNRQILVDPGTYLYTGDSMLRNYFRAVRQHTTFYPNDWPELISDELFSLPIPAANFNSEQRATMLQAKHSYFGFETARSVFMHNGGIAIYDSWNAKRKMAWSWIWHPDIDLQEQSPFEWRLSYKGNPILRFESKDMSLCRQTCWFSQRYGLRQRTQKLIGTATHRMNSARFYFYPI